MLLKFVDMKKFIAFIGAMVAGLLVFQSCEEHKINPDKLPEAAQTFISQFFPGTTVFFLERQLHLPKRKRMTESSSIMSVFPTGQKLTSTKMAYGQA